MEESLKDVRNAIVEAARTVFGKYGFKKTTMDEIAEAAHKGKSSLYHYFTNKEEVFQAVIEKEFSMLEKIIVDTMKKEETPQGKMRAYVIARMEALNRLANFYSAFKDEYLESYSFIQKMRQRYDEYEINMFKEILREGVQKGIFVVKDLDLYAFAIFTAMKGLEYYYATENDIARIQENINSLFEILFNGIMKQ
jgi:AcrR family transcriptional regulator